MSVMSCLKAGRVTFLSDFSLKIYLYLDDLLTTNKVYFVPPILVSNPYPMSICITYPKIDRGFYGVFIYFYFIKHEKLTNI